jgi:ribosomal protein S18 acetylase RimI-like enzyme
VRRARADEAELVYAILREAFAEYAGTLPVESGALRETLEDVQAAMAEGGGVLAFIDDVAVGSARYLPEDDAIYVNRVAVRPGYRRRGIAIALMTYLEDVARSLGKDAIHIGVRQSLPSNVALYERLGYVTVRVDPHPGGPDKSLSMIKRISVP